MSYKAEVTHHGLLDIQVCVPATWTDAEVVRFAEGQFPSGTSGGWQIRREGDEFLSGSPERNPCAKREGYVHIMLDA